MADGLSGSYARDRISTTLARSPRAVSEAPPSEELGFETLCRGASDTATAPGDYGICIWMSGSCSFASVPLRSECLGFSSGSQREWSWGGALERLERTTILHSEERETQNYLLS